MTEIENRLVHQLLLEWTGKPAKDGHTTSPVKRHLGEIVGRELGVELSEEDLFSSTDLSTLASTITQRLPRLSDGTSIITCYQRIRKMLVREVGCSQQIIHWDSLWHELGSGSECCQHGRCRAGYQQPVRNRRPEHQQSKHRGRHGQQRKRCHAGRFHRFIGYRLRNWRRGRRRQRGRLHNNVGRGLRLRLGFRGAPLDERRRHVGNLAFNVPEGTAALARKELLNRWRCGQADAAMLRRNIGHARRPPVLGNWRVLETHPRHEQPKGRGKEDALLGVDPTP